MSAPSGRKPSWGRLIAIGVTLIVLLSPFLWLLQMSFKFRKNTHWPMPRLN